jgi:hypothetical protein
LIFGITGVIIMTNDFTIRGYFSMEKQIMWAALIFLGGWLWFYFMLRQLIFNFTSAIPLLNRYRKASKELITVNAGRFLVISIVVWTVICGAIAYVVVRFASTYLWASFLGGGLLGVLLTIPHLGPYVKANYRDFCMSYYRFVPDDELRTAMYDFKLGQMKVRLDAMGIDKSIVIPEFKKEK